MTQPKKPSECSEGGDHDLGGKRVTTGNWISMMICCPCYMTLALYRVAATPLPCKCCNGIEDEDEYGNPRCRKCGLSKEESISLEQTQQPQMRVSQYGTEARN